MQLTYFFGASIVREKVLQWNQDHATPTPAEIKAELKRLQNLLISQKQLLEVGGYSREVDT